MKVLKLKRKTRKTQKHKRPWKHREKPCKIYRDMLLSQRNMIVAARGHPLAWYALWAMADYGKGEAYAKFGVNALLC